MANNPRASVDEALFAVLQNAYPWAYSSMHFQGWGSFSDKQPAMFLRRIRERIVSPKGPMLLKYTYEYECWIYLQTQKDDPNINPYLGSPTNSQLASDNFNRSNGPLGPNWTTVADANQIVSNQVEATVLITEDGIDNTSFYNAVSAPSDQYSQVTIGNIKNGQGGNNPDFGVVLRATSASSYYSLVLQDNDNGTIGYEIFRTPGTFALSEGYAPGSLIGGSVIFGSVIGSLLQISLNGNLITSTYDPLPLKSGQFGVAVNDYVFLSDGSISSWSGGSATLANGIDPIVDAIDSALAASPVSGKNTLGGLVNECYIDGTIMLADGTDDGQCVIRIPIVTTTAI